MDDTTIEKLAERIADALLTAHYAAPIKGTRLQIMQYIGGGKERYIGGRNRESIVALVVEELRNFENPKLCACNHAWRG